MKWNHARSITLAALAIGLVLTACDTDSETDPEPEAEVERDSPDEPSAADDDPDAPTAPEAAPDDEADDEADDPPRDERPLGVESQPFDGPFFDTSTSSGTIRSTEDRAYVGDRSMEVTVESPSGFGFSRVQERVWWEEGDEVVYGAAVYLEPGFNDAQADGSVDILRWDNWDEQPEDADHGGLTILSSGQLALISESAGNVPWTVLLGPYEFPEGEWVSLEVRQRLSETAGQADNQVWMNGELLDQNSEPNYFGRPITRFRVGIIGTPDPQPGRLRMFVDDALVAREGLDPAAAISE